MKAKVLILSNPLNHEGGVVNYYNLFFKNFKSNVIAVEHASIGSRAYLFYYPILKRLLYPFYYIFDVFLYVVKLIFDRKIKIVQVSPSLIPVPLIRDGLLVLLAKLLGKNVVVFYRGWKMPTYKKIEHNKILKRIFNKVFQKDTVQVVLASSFKQDLINLTPKNSKSILVTTTAIDKTQIMKPDTELEQMPIKVLFLGRVQDLKGIEELIQAVIELKKLNQLSAFQFSIVGHESKSGYVEYIKDKLKTNGVPKDKVVFLGRITGESKYQLYACHDIYILPSYTEGCPNSVLEALASGLFCITTKVGALSDLIIPKENGMFVPVKDSDAIVKALQYCMHTKDFNYKRMVNAEYYSEAFDIKKITKLFEAKYIDLIEGK